MNPSELPADLPVPVDDGAADHLAGASLPRTPLPATDGTRIDIGGIAGRLVLYVYPMTGPPDGTLPAGWNDIPGARGCTPQSCAFRDHHAELAARAAVVHGLSMQGSDYQAEAKARLQLPFELISDSGLVLNSALALPTFSVEGNELYRRITLIAIDGRVEKVFYPVFPPDRNAQDVLDWLDGQ